MGFYGFRDIRDAITLKQMATERRGRPDSLSARSKLKPGEMFGASYSAVAITTAVIPGRSGKTPGGPIDCIIQKSRKGSDFVTGDTAAVYSWVNSDSPDPADFDNDEMYIFISQDPQGTWWYHAIDCLQPPPPEQTLPGDGSSIPSDGTEVIYVS